MSCYRLIVPTNFVPVLSPKPSPCYVTATIAVDPVVRKFLARNYPVAPFLISAKGNPYSSYLAACLDRQIGFEKQPALAEYTATLTVAVADWRQRGGFGRQLSPARVVAFNRFAKQNFMHRVMTELVVKQMAGQSVVRSIKSILNRYQLTEDELSLDTVLRYYTRTRESYVRELASDGIEA